MGCDAAHISFKKPFFLSNVEAVTNAPDCLEKLWFVWIDFERLAQPTDMHIQGARITSVFGVPNLAE